MYLDNTNADPATREVWVKLAQKLNVPIRCVLFMASIRLCEHNDAVRALSLGPEVSSQQLVHGHTSHHFLSAQWLYYSPIRQSCC